MSTCRRPQIEYPTRVPMKFIGREGEFLPEAVLALIIEHLGVQSEGDGVCSSNRKGAYLCHTYWVVLKDEHVEKPLREAVAKLPGYIMQL